MTTKTQAVTADELLRMPDDGFRYELINGELIRMVPAGHQHGRIIINITTPLDQYVRKHNLGTVYAAATGFKLSSNPDTVRAPDIAFVTRGRVQKVFDNKGYWPGAPDLAVEVISPTDSYTHVEAKVSDWLLAGTRMVVVVNPDKHIVTVFCSLTDIVKLTENDTLDGGDIVPGWSISVKDIFI